MKEILDKLTSYNLFNYLVPGVLFVAILDSFTSYSFIQEDLVLGAFVYYFVGLVISRVGSLIIEPVLKKISFIRFARYADFVSAAKSDPKLETLSEANNMYRTFISMFSLLIILKSYELLSIKWTVLNEGGLYVLIGLLLVMFLLSYRKQTTFIRDRVDSTKP